MAYKNAFTNDTWKPEEKEGYQRASVWDNPKAAARWRAYTAKEARGTGFMDFIDRWRNVLVFLVLAIEFFILLKVFPPYPGCAADGYWWAIGIAIAISHPFVYLLFGDPSQVEANARIHKRFLSPVGKHVYDNYTEYQAIVSSVSKTVSQQVAEELKSKDN